MMIEQATPAQLAEHEAHKARIRRMFPAPIQRVRPEPTPPIFVPPPAPLTPQKSWEERQREIPLPPRPANWFSIIAEVLPRHPKLPPVDQVMRICAAHFMVSKAAIKSDSRTADIVYPRQVAMFMARELTQRSLPEIGRRFGGRDHTTVLHATRKIERLSREDWRVAHDIASIDLLFRGAE